MKPLSLLLLLSVLFYRTSLYGQCAAPTTPAVTACSAGTYTLSAMSTGGSVTGHNWYTSWGSSITPTTSYKIGNRWVSTYTVYLASATTFYVSAICNGEESEQSALNFSLNQGSAFTAGISYSPFKQNFCAGETIVLTATSNYSASSYQWRQNGANISGATSASYSVQASSTAQLQGISVVVTGSNGCSISSVTVSLQGYSLSVSPLVTPSVRVTANPGSSITEGTAVSFTATASNAGSTPAFLWLIDGNPAPGSPSGPVYTNSVLLNGQKVSCRVTVSAGVCASLSQAVSEAITMHVSPLVNLNYIKQNIVASTGVTGLAGVQALAWDKKRISTTYYDGLGRPLQEVQAGGSPLGNDQISPREYDSRGRESRRFLPYATSGGLYGQFRPEATTEQEQFYASAPAGVVQTGHAYADLVFEASPEDRLLEEGFAGDAWQPYSAGIPGSGHTVESGYGCNGFSDWPAIRLYRAVAGSGAERTLESPGNYQPGRLYQQITRDENHSGGRSGSTETYKDKEGRTVLRRVWEDENIFRSTYYVYDHYGNLIFVLPAGSEPDEQVPDQTALDRYCYQYRYDERGRQTGKRIPGKDGWDLLVYNDQDQVILSQDPRQGQSGVWTFNNIMPSVIW